MIRESLKKYLCTQLFSVLQAMEKIDSNGKGMLFVVDSEGKVRGCITDGDIRRWILLGGDLKSNVNMIMNANPVTILSHQCDDAEYLAKLRNLKAIPVVDTERHIEDILFYEDLKPGFPHIYIIAEAGVNHNGDVKLAYKLIDAAKESGADCVKFQTFVPEKLVSSTAKKADYQTVNIGKADEELSQLEMLKQLSLPFEDYVGLKEYADQLGIDFISTPFECDSVEFLNTLDIPFWKIPSGQVKNLPYLLAIAKTKKPVVMSTGMCTMDEVKDSIRILKKNGTPSVTVLQCNTQYPTPYEDVNLNVIKTMKKELGVPVGYSDHTLGIAMPIAAVAVGATVIEKHFTLDRNMKGPDHKASLEPNELKTMVESIRSVEKAMGNYDKKPSPSETPTMAVARESIIASKPIKKGDVLTEDNLIVKRPGTGIDPMKWFEVIGTKAIRDFEADELIEI